MTNSTAAGGSKNLKSYLVPLALGLLFLGCPQTPSTNDSGSCDGEIGCACLNGTTCNAGECIGSTCVDCRRGDEACICRSNGTCNTGLKCTNSSCVTCTKGSQDCPCDVGDTCGAGLACTAGTCTPINCTPGTNACPCRSGDPKCDGTDYCDSSTVCRSCSPDIAGCPCGAANVCSGGLTCDSNTTKCRAPLTCAAMQAAGTCKPHQVCTDGQGTDATCVAATCDAQFKWDSASNTCLACVSQDCASEPTCMAGDGGIGDSCAAQNRTCTQNGMVAACGPCVVGYIENASQVCVPAPACGGAFCTLSEYCDATGPTPTCRTLPCAAGQAKDTLVDGGVGGTCASCTRTCVGEGFSGRIWPFRSLGGQCLCETLNNYFIAGGVSGQATKCDADNDGWVHEDADKNTDPALRANARCSIRKADRVRLVDEFGTALELVSCTVGGMQAKQADGGDPCVDVLPLRLLETERNDIPGQATVVTRAPFYGATDAGTLDGGPGRYLAAQELNSLTKACVATVADYNGNGVDDIAETPPAPPVATPDDRVRLESFAYFMELHTSYFEANDAGVYGRLVIQERSRCGIDFPLHYDPAVNPMAPNDGFKADAGTTYWRTCGRRRDPAYDRATPLPNFDFGQWGCAATAGTCAFVPPAHPTEIAPTNPQTKLLRNYGLCAMNGAAPADGLWRGMTHHSQFKCVSVTSSPQANGFDKLTSDFNANGKYVLNQCSARFCQSPTDTNCRTQQGAGLQSPRPVVDCKPVIPAPAGAVGFAAVKFQGYGSGYTPVSYQGGCVTEDIETAAVMPLNTAYLSYLCPYPEYNSLFSAAVNQKPKVDAAFGRISCYNDLPNFMWANPVERATLRWASSPTDTASGFLR